VFRFLVNEAFMGQNGTVGSRTYTYSTSFNDGKVLNSVNLPLMNGTQFMVCMWVSTGFSSLSLICIPSHHLPSLCILDN
jgi:hypothetical protein